MIHRDFPGRRALADTPGTQSPSASAQRDATKSNLSLLSPRTLSVSLLCISLLLGAVTPALAIPLASNLVLHLDANTRPGLNDGDAVTNWLDTSGLSNHAIPSSISSPAPGTPTYVENASPLGNLPVVRFDPSNSDVLALTNELVLQPSFSLFAMVRRAALGDYFIMGAPLPVGTNQQIRIGWPTLNSLTVYNGNAASSTQPLTTPVGDFMLVEYIMDNGTFSFFENGVDLGGGATGSNLFKLGAVGAFDTRGLGTFNGDIASILIYDTALNATDRASVESFLDAQWFQPQTSSSGTGSGNAPAPATVWLALLGFAGLLLRRRRVV